VPKSYVSRILRMALLAPDILDAILAGRTDQGVMLEKLERQLPVSWQQQRQGAPCFPAAASRSSTVIPRLLTPRRLGGNVRIPAMHNIAPARPRGPQARGPKLASTLHQEEQVDATIGDIRALRS
jgi:hypothetical protein